MPDSIVHFGAMVQCSHGGVATPLSPNPRVTVSGFAVITIGSSYAVTGCSLTSSGVFCSSGQWVSGSQRVKVMGVPVAIRSGGSVCSATGNPMRPITVQPRAVAM